MASLAKRKLLSSTRILKFYLPIISTYNYSTTISSSNPLNLSSPSSTLGIHVFNCPDVVGIVAKLSECIAKRGANLHIVDVFVPENKKVFYSRSEFVFDPASWPRDVMDKDFMEISNLFKAEKSVVRVPDLDPKYKIAVFASKQDHCLVDLLHKWQEGRLPVDIKCVISNHERGPNTHVMRFLERNRIPYHCLPTSKVMKREEEILDLVNDTDFIVLARYMQLPVLFEYNRVSMLNLVASLVKIVGKIKSWFV